MTVKSTNAFFEKKKQWSEIKDQLLRCYLMPYITKILMHGGPVRYIDCFAGAGRFEDGSEGSPLIALKEIRAGMETSFSKNKDVKLYFIEKEHAEALSDVLGGDPLIGGIIEGCFETELIPLAERFKGMNLFCYIDPFGVKVLDLNLLNQLLQIDFRTIELLINFNSFGFFRWACAHENVKIDSNTEDEFRNFMEDVEISGSISSDESLNQVLGTDKWKEVIAEYKYKKTLENNAGKNAVKKIASLYLEALRKRFKFVLDIPISVKQGGKTEYHMFFATNSPDGAILMGDSMGKRAGEMSNIRDCGQLSLFENSKDPSADLIDVLTKLKNHGGKKST